MQKNKGVFDLINAIPKIDKKYHFLLMGYPNEEAKKLAESLGISNRITFTGKIDYFKAGSYLKLGDYAISPKKTSDSLEANAKLYAYKAMGLKTYCYDTIENKDIIKGLGIYIKTFDKICLVGALIAISLYLFLHNALLSVIVVTLTDFIGFLPTIRKSYAEPKTETLSTYGLSSASSAFALFALTNFNITTSLYLITLVITNGLCAVIILVQRK